MVIRKNINVATLEKIKDFLKEQDKPIFISDIVKNVGVDCHSVKMAISMLNVRTNKDRRIKIKC